MMSLTLAQCPLATQKLVDTHNQLEAQLAELQRQLPQLWAEKDVAAAREKFGRAAWRLQRSAYRVGLLGRSQAGKSSTVNRILGVSRDEDGPCYPGKGKAATSNITRIRIIPGGSNHTCKLRYFSTKQFAEFRLGICKDLALEPQKPNATLIGELDRIIQRYYDDQEKFARDARSEVAQTSGMDARQDDREFFRRMLQAYETFGRDFIRDESRIDPVPFDQRTEHTNHPEDRQATPSMLIYDVHVGFATAGVDPRLEKLEMFDLPGWGAGYVDRIRTELALPKLDASLVFQSTDHVKTPEALDLLQKLREYFGSLHHRVWMVVTKFDAQAKHVLAGEKNKPTLLDNIYSSAKTNFVPTDQVLFVANEFHREWLDRQGQISADVYSALLKLDTDAAGKPIIPEALQRHPEMYQAYRHVVDDGGIKHLRETVGMKLADEIQAAMREAIGRDLNQSIRGLVTALEFDEEKSRMNDADFLRATSWQNQVHRVMHDLESNRILLEKPGNKLILALHKKFVEAFPADVETPRRLLAERHIGCMRFLKQFATGYFRTEVAPLVQQTVRVALETYAQRDHLAPLRLPHHASPVEALTTRMASLLTQSAWYEEEFAALENDRLYPAPGTDGPSPDLRYEQYRVVAAHKLDAVAHRTMHEFARRLNEQLGELEHELTALASHNAGGAVAVNQQVYQSLLKELRSLTDER